MIEGLLSLAKTSTSVMLLVAAFLFLVFLTVHVATFAYFTAKGLAQRYTKTKPKLKETNEKV